MLLAIDTSAGTSVAVVDRDAGVLAERSSPDTRGHAEVVGTLITECLAVSGIDVPSLSAVAVGTGPGPFTGLRVGIAAARAFALGTGIPVVHVASHDASAFGHYLGGATGPVMVVTDARRSEVYWSAYRGADALGLPERGLGPLIAKRNGLESTNASRMPLLEITEVSAGALGLLAERLWQHGRPFADAEPLYLRSPDVTIAAGPKRVS